MEANGQNLDHISWIQAQWRRERPELDVSPQGILGRLRRVNDRITEELIAVYDQFGLAEGEFDVLATLRRVGAPFELTPGQVAEQTLVTSGAATKRLQRLEARGLVAKRAEDHDGRTRTVWLTAAGKELIDAAFTAHIANEHRLLDQLSAADREALQAGLTAWMDLLEPR